MDRNIEHFEERLTQETFTKDEVAKLLYNEADFTAQQTRKDFDGFVSREDFDTMSTELASVKSELSPYKQADFDALVGGEFGKLNGNSDRVNDFKTLAKLTGNETSEDVLAKVTEFKDSGKYEFMFTKTESGAAQQKHNVTESPKTYVKGAFTPKMGGYNLFKRK